MDFTSRLKSLTDIVDCDMADFYVLDSSKIGNSFLLGKERTEFDVVNARSNNISEDQIKKYLESSSRSLEFIMNYSNVLTVPTVINELKDKLKTSKTFYENYGHRNGHKGINGHRHPHSINRIKDKIKRIKYNEDKIFEIISARVPIESNKKELNSYKQLVIDSVAWKGSNTHDEEIIANSIYHAFRLKKHFAIITGDFRFKSIVESTQISLNNGNGPRALKEFLQRGNISLIGVGDNGDFEVKYCSLDFEANYAPKEEYALDKK